MDEGNRELRESLAGIQKSINKLHEEANKLKAAKSAEELKNRL